MKIVYLGLGSNIGEREVHLRRALEALEHSSLRLKRVSGVYETAPRDLTEQRHFLNLVAEAESDFLPMRLLKHAHDVERALGRQRLMPNGPRTIDIDILLFGRAIVDTPQLVIPHPRLHERRFVLEPLCDLAPELRHPVLHRSMRELLAGTAGQQSRLWGRIAGLKSRAG